MLDWHSYQICYPLEIKILLLLLCYHIGKCQTSTLTHVIERTSHKIDIVKIK